MPWWGGGADSTPAPSANAKNYLTPRCCTVSMKESASRNPYGWQQFKKSVLAALKPTLLRLSFATPRCVTHEAPRLFSVVSLLPSPIIAEGKPLWNAETAGSC